MLSNGVCISHAGRLSTAVIAVCFMAGGSAVHADMIDLYEAKNDANSTTTVQDAMIAAGTYSASTYYDESDYNIGNVGGGFSGFGPSNKDDVSVNGYDTSRKALIQFDLPDNLTGATINSAYFTVQLGNSGYNNVQTGIYQLLHAWVEGTGSSWKPTNDSSSNVFSGVSWNSYNGVDNGNDLWNAPGLQSGTDYVAIEAGTILAQNNSDVQTSTDLKTMVQYWADNPAENYGFLLQFDPSAPDNAISGYMTLSESSNSLNVPHLIIDYTPAAVPEPASLTLLAAGAGLVVFGRHKREVG